MLHDYLLLLIVIVCDNGMVLYLIVFRKQYSGLLISTCALQHWIPCFAWTLHVLYVNCHLCTMALVYVYKLAIHKCCYILH